MSYLYYSTFCKHSSKLLRELSSSSVKDDFYYISVDKRFQNNGKVMIRLGNNEEIEIPESIEKVPALLLKNYGGRVLFGNDIYNFIHEQENNKMKNLNPIHEEPLPFAFEVACNNVSSDHYSFLDINPEELLAKGNGGSRQMYHYANLDYTGMIETPPDSYVPDTIGKDEGSLEKLIEQREKDANDGAPKRPILT